MRRRKEGAAEVWELGERVQARGCRNKCPHPGQLKTTETCSLGSGHQKPEIQGPLPSSPEVNFLSEEGRKPPPFKRKCFCYPDHHCYPDQVAVFRPPTVNFVLYKCAPFTSSSPWRASTQSGPLQAQVTGAVAARLPQRPAPCARPPGAAPSARRLPRQRDLCGHGAPRSSRACGLLCGGLRRQINPLRP